MLSTVYRRRLHVTRGRRAPASASGPVPPPRGFRVPRGRSSCGHLPPGHGSAAAGAAGGGKRPATLWAVRPDGQEGRPRLPACGDAGNVPAFVIRGPSRAAGSNARTSHRHALEKTTRQPAPRFLSKRRTWASRWKGVALSRREGQWGSPASFGELVPKRRAHQHRGATRHLSVVIVFTGSNSVLRS